MAAEYQIIRKPVEPAITQEFAEELRTVFGVLPDDMEVEYLKRLWGSSQKHSRPANTFSPKAVDRLPERQRNVVEFGRGATPQQKAAVSRALNYMSKYGIETMGGVRDLDLSKKYTGGDFSNRLIKIATMPPEIKD